jgi:hypothetical protein
MHTRNYVKATGDTPLFFRDWREGELAVFVARRTLDARPGPRRMTAFTTAGLRCIASERYAHCRTDGPGERYNFNTLADDLMGTPKSYSPTRATSVGSATAAGNFIAMVIASGNVTLVFIGHDAADTSFLTEVGSSASFLLQLFGRKLHGHAFGHRRQSRHAIGRIRLGVASHQRRQRIRYDPQGARQRLSRVHFAELCRSRHFSAACACLIGDQDRVADATPGAVWYTGFENRLNGDYDYNDFVIAAILTPDGVPEPASPALFGAGLLAACRTRFVA